MATLVSDVFTRANADALGSNWTEEVGDWDILSNQAVTNIQQDNMAYWSGTFNPASADYDITADCKISGNVSGVGVLGRRTASTTYYYLVINTFDQTLYLGKRIAGTWTDLATFVGGYTNDTVYTLKLTMVGSTLTGYVNGTQRVQVTNSDITATGKPAIFGDYDSSIIDNFLVEGTEAGGSPTVKTLASLGVG